MARATVPESRLDLTQGDLAISRAVRSATWVNAARLQCWLAGRGAMVVPVHAPDVTIPTSTASTFRYQVPPRYQTTRYALTLSLSVATGAVPSSCSVKFPASGSAVSVPVGTDDAPRFHTLYADRGARGTTEAGLDFEITGGASVGTVVDAVSIEAVPRAFLDVDASDLGANRYDFLFRRPITENDLPDQLLEVQDELRDACRRVGCFQHSFGSDDPWSTTSTSYTAIWDATAPVQGRYIYDGDTTRTLSWRARAYASDGTTSANIRVTTESGNTDVIAMSTGSSSPAWFPSTGGAASTFAVDAEDPTAADGRRGSAWDDLTFEVQRTAGSGTVYVESISVFEA